MTTIDMKLPDNCMSCGILAGEGQEAYCAATCQDVEAMKKITDITKERYHHCPLAEIESDVVEGDGSARCQQYDCNRPLPKSIIAGYLAGIYKYCPTCGRLINGRTDEE